MTDISLYDPADIPIGSPGQPLNNGHLAAHSQIKSEIIVNANTIARLPTGLAGIVTGPPAIVTAPGATATIVMAATVPIITGRRYRFHVSCTVTQITAANTGCYCYITDTSNIIQGWRPWQLGVPMGIGAIYSGGNSRIYIPTLSQNVTFELGIFTSTNSMTVVPGNAEISVEDLGAI